MRPVGLVAVAISKMEHIMQLQAVGACNFAPFAEHQEPRADESSQCSSHRSPPTCDCLILDVCTSCD